MSQNHTTPCSTEHRATARLTDIPAGEFGALLWSRLLTSGGWHPTTATHIDALAQALSRTPPAQLTDTAHPLWTLLEALQVLAIGYQPELGKTAERGLGDIDTILRECLADSCDRAQWAQAARRIAELNNVEQTRQRRIEQRLIDAAHGQWRSQRARQQAAQVLNRCMAGKKLAADITAWLQGEWFNELQWCLLHHGDAGVAWQRRAEVTLRLVASLQTPGDETGARQTLYALIPEVTAELRALLDERAYSATKVEESLAAIERQHLLLLRGRQPQSAPFKLLATDSPWLADISLSRELLTRIEGLAPGQWFTLRDDGERRVKLILKQQDVGQLLFVNQLGVKALQVSIEEFAYRLAADLALPLPGAEAGRAALMQTLDAIAERLQTAEKIRAEEAAALQRQREQVRQRIETEARQRALAKAKAAAEARALAAEQARAEAEAAAMVEAENQRLQDSARLEAQHLQEQEQLRHQELLSRQSAESDQRQRLARLQATTLTIGHWIELHDEKGHLQRLKLAVKLPTSGKMIFVDREGVRQAELSRDQLIGHLLDNRIRITEQGQIFEDSLARVVDGMRRDSSNRE